MKRIFICDHTKPQEVLDLCQKNNFGIELQSFYQPEALTDSELVEKTAFMTEGISVKSLHGPFGDLCPGSFDGEVRELAKKRFEQAWNVARRLNVSHIVFHHGYVPNTSHPSGWLKRWPEFWRNFLQDKNEDVHIHIENHLDYEPSLISEAVALVARKNSFDINLDIGHVHFASDMPIVKWIETLKDQIGYVHLHDNNGENDEHLGLGRGSIPIEEVCQALEECAPNAIWAIEAEGDGIAQSLELLDKLGFLKGERSAHRP